MSKPTLSVATPVGVFTRTTATNYTHIVVWNSPRALEEAARETANKTASGRPVSGVQARWIKDRGYGVTWHGSEAAANRAARAGYSWDSKATEVGVFAVALAIQDSPASAEWTELQEIGGV